MPVKKIKSKEYLGFLATKRCPITGSTKIEIHHESLLRQFSGGMKKYNDFQALPLDVRLHLYERHASGKEEFWSRYEVNPYDVCISLIEGYLSTLPKDSDLATEQLEELKKQKERWNYDSKERYIEL